MSNVTLDHALVALDQSDASDIMVDCLNHFQRFGTRKFTLFTSVSVSYPGGVSETSEQQYRDKMEEYAQKLDSAGFEIDTEVRFNINAYAPTEILNAAEDHGADYIIMANRGHSKYRELLLGSTTTELLQRCSLPVYLINLSISGHDKLEERNYHCIKACKDSLQRILYPTDFSDTANRAFNVLCDLVTEQTRQITLLHVQASGRKGVDDPDELEKFNRKDSRQLENLKENLQEYTIASIDLRIQTGSPTQHILDTAEDMDASMIVMGSQGRGYVNDLFLGGVSLQVIRNAHIPILTIPTQRE